MYVYNLHVMHKLVKRLKSKRLHTIISTCTYVQPVFTSCIIYRYINTFLLSESLVLIFVHLL